MFAVGLTGGIGSGKSTVAELFAGHGTAIIDTDAIAHALTGPDGAAMPALISAFGPTIADHSGALDRAVMRERVFSVPQERAQLESLLHPMITAQALRDAERAAATHPYVMFVVPLLVESGHWAARVDRVLVVDCTETVQIDRVLARSGMTRARVESIIAAQASRERRRAAAHEIIDNSGPPQALVPIVRALHEKYCDLAKQKAAQRG